MAFNGLIVRIPDDRNDWRVVFESQFRHAADHFAVEAGLVKPTFASDDEIDVEVVIHVELIRYEFEPSDVPPTQCGQRSAEAACGSTSLDISHVDR